MADKLEQKLSKITDNLGADRPSPDSQDRLGDYLDIIIDNMGGGGGSKKILHELIYDGAHIKNEDGEIIGFADIKLLLDSPYDYVYINDLTHKAIFHYNAYEDDALWFNTRYLISDEEHLLRLIINDSDEIRLNDNILPSLTSSNTFGGTQNFNGNIKIVGQIDTGTTTSSKRFLVDESGKYIIGNISTNIDLRGQNVRPVYSRWNVNKLDIKDIALLEDTAEHIININATANGNTYKCQFQFKAPSTTAFATTGEIASYLYNKNTSLRLPASGTFTEGGVKWCITGISTLLEGEQKKLVFEMNKFSDGSERETPMTSFGLEVVDIVM